MVAVNVPSSITIASRFALFAAIVSCVTGRRTGEPDFLGRRNHEHNHHTHALARKPLTADSDLLTNLEKAVGHDLRAATESRVPALEEAVRPLFWALPQDSSGKIGGDAVRYVLHRLFVQRHGWVVQGLETAGETWNSSSPVKIFSPHVGADVQDLFEKHLNDHGFGVHQVAVMAATLESFVHQEVMERLAASYRVLGYYPQQEGLTEAEGIQIIDTYMMLYVLGLNHHSVTPEEMEETARTVQDVYPSWPETSKFVRELRQSLLDAEDGQDGARAALESRTSWSANMKVLEEMGNRYGQFQNRECRGLKQALLSIEETGSTGRVSIDEFYGSALSDDKWQFLESVPYLQQLGALDDSDERRVRVIIPNYMNSLTNCLASSKFYSVCCIDECDPLQRRLEEAVGAPEASPQRIAELVAALPSDTTEAPRELPRELLRRLDEVAESHGGQVLLHGRLFAQWMHFAFPRECPYPHMSGTTRPQTPFAWMEATGEDVVASEEDMRRLISGADKKTASPLSSSASAAAAEFDATATLWTNEEELFISRPVEIPEPASPSISIGKGLTLVAVPFSLALVFLRAFGPTEQDEVSREKFHM